MKIRFLSAFIAAALCVGTAQAKEPPQAQTAEQQSARAEIKRLVERIQVLSKQLGEDANMYTRIERHPIARQEVRSRPGLGIVMSPNSAASGVRIVAISPDSPAMKSGLRSGDVLLFVDGKSIGGSGIKAVDNARHLLGDLKQGQTVKLRYARQGKTYDANVKAEPIRRVMALNRDELGPMAAWPRMHERDGNEGRRVRMLPPDVEMDIERMGPMDGCAPGKDDCDLPALYQAFRWQGLNLASLDASLGRYFGTDKGVLVLSSSPELAGLQSGDVIRHVAGNEVQSPRDVMRALRDKSSGSRLQFDILRDRKSLAVTVTVPKSRPLPFMAPPPPPPAPPSPPTPPSAMRAPHAVAAPPPPPAPPAVPAAPRAPRAAPPPPPPPPERDDDSAFAPEAIADEMEI